MSHAGAEQRARQALAQLVGDAASLPTAALRLGVAAAMRRGEVWSTGSAELDRALGGGLSRGALHAIVPATGVDAGAATGLTLAFAALAMRGDPAGARPFFWIAEARALVEHGAPHGRGLLLAGLAAERCRLVRVRNTRDLLWAAEEVLRTVGVGAVVIEPWLVASRGPASALDHKVLRRLMLAAQAGGALALLLFNAGAPGVPTATRWRVAAGVGPPGPGVTPGCPAWHVVLERNRGGWPGRWCLTPGPSGTLAAQPLADPPLSPVEMSHVLPVHAPVSGLPGSPFPRGGAALPAVRSSGAAGASAVATPRRRSA